MISKKNLIGKKAGITYLQIFLLITFIFALSYLIADNVESVDATLGDVCCEETAEGLICQDTAIEECNNEYNVSATSCETTDFCQTGCCFSPQTGLCNRNAPMRSCAGDFFLEPFCNIAECEKGCCILGDQAMWTTEKNCEFEGDSRNKDVPTEFLIDENHNTELECIFSIEKDKEGACVYESGDERKCIWTTLEDCYFRTGSENNFDREGRYCSDPALNTTCEARNRKGCQEGEEDVYWFDSCDNPEGVVEDCDIYSGSYCGEDKETGRVFCKDVDCLIDGKLRKNGESWCEYDGAIGLGTFEDVKETYTKNRAGSRVLGTTGSGSSKDGYGRDTVGSRHVKHICYMGTERLEPCADYRNEICVEETATGVGGAQYSEAACRVNQWRTCLDIASGRENIPKMESMCNKNPDCFVKHVQMGTGFNFKFCVPRYPPGFDLGGEFDPQGKERRSYSGMHICDIASQQCTEDWVCGIFGCVCVTNCLCHTSYFTEKMNEFCVSLGDCGAYVNWVGAATDSGYFTKGAPRLSMGYVSKYKKNALPHPNQPPASPGNMEFFETLNPASLTEVPSAWAENLSGNLTEFEEELLTVSGSMGSALLLQMLADHNETEAATRATPRLTNYARFSNGAGSAKASISSQIVHEKQEVKDFSMIAALIAGLIAYLITQMILIAMIAAMIAFFLFMAWPMTTYVDFVCDLWEPPDGGADCNKCNKLEVPCTEYRCHSLGSLCQFINKGTDNELCVARPENVSLPKIEPLLSVISDGYKYTNIADDGFDVTKEDGTCLEAFTTIKMGIKVTPFSRCRFGVDPLQKYEEMTEKFGPKGNIILPIHRMDIFHPTPEALQNTYNLTQEQLEELSNIIMYIKCKTASGKINPEPYKITTCIDPGPDLTAPRITIADPLTGAHLPYGLEEKDVIFYVNEPSKCRWDLTNKNFTEMENPMTCKDKIFEYKRWGLPCETKLNVQNNSKFFVKCQDLSVNENTMTDPYVYELKLTQTPLEITDIVPELGTEITEGFEPVTVTLKISTSGGAESGRARCNWRRTTGSKMSDRFRETDASIHKSELNMVRRGRWNMEFACFDVAGNTANATSWFDVKIDASGPQIIRAYYDMGLKVVTSEPAECRYSFDRNFKFDNASSMGTGLTEHYAPWTLNTYYVQCQDDFQNKGRKLKIKAYDLI